MSLSLEMITVDCADPHRLAAWWADAVAGKGETLGRGRVPVGGPGRSGRQRVLRGRATALSPH